MCGECTMTNFATLKQLKHRKNKGLRVIDEWKLVPIVLEIGPIYTKK